MPKTSSGYLPLTNQTGGGEGAAADEFLYVYQDAASKPSKPSDSAGIPVGWITSVPTNVTNTVWVTLGKKTEGIGNYVWSNVLESSGTQNNVTGSNGTNGARGSGFFKGDNTASTVPVINDSDFIADANALVTGGTPVEGDVVYITYTGATNKDELVAIYDGTNWTAFTNQIDGNLLVNGTVVADSIKTNAVITNVIQGGEKTSSSTNNGQQGFYLDGNGNFVIGNGADDMFMVGGGMNIPAVNTVSPTLITTSITGSGTASNNQPTQAGYTTPWSASHDYTMQWNPGVGNVYYDATFWDATITLKVGSGYGYSFVPDHTIDMDFTLKVEAIDNSTGSVIDTQSTTYNFVSSFTQNIYNQRNLVYHAQAINNTLSLANVVNNLNLEQSDATTDFTVQYPSGIRFKHTITCTSESNSIPEVFVTQPLEVLFEIDVNTSPVQQVTQELSIPSDVYINYSTADSSKYVMKVEDGRGFRAKPEVLYTQASPGNGVEVLYNGGTPGPYYGMKFPIEDIQENAAYLCVMENPADRGSTNNYGLKDVQYVVYFGDDHFNLPQDLIHHDSNGNQVGCLSISGQKSTSGSNQFIEFFSEQRGDDGTGGSVVNNYHRFLRIVRLF